MNIRAGIDLGSRFIKVAIESGGDVGEVSNISLHSVSTIDFYKLRAKLIRDGVSNIEKALLSYLSIPQGAAILATGYGRNVLQMDNISTISEIKAHFYGVKRQLKGLNSEEQNSFTILDVGGQDCKVINVKGGYIDDFVMNDKCAASTGRFVENAATALGMTLGSFSSAVNGPITLPSTCAVFCESELIGLLAQGANEETLAASVNCSIAKRLSAMISRYKPSVIITASRLARNS
ncbi:acyl-CoA dehydratase activase [Deferribacterales bacterium RsTz2092]|nr:2-hydroxyglutaryl-CoA dehydratase [Deferribacterales bacterium]